MSTSSFPLEISPGEQPTGTSVQAVGASVRPAPKTVDASAYLPLIDWLRGLAAVTIVLHHLAFYGPLSDVAYPLAPAIIDWLFNYGRMAVQVFLVLAGFGTAQRLARLPDLGLRGLAKQIVTRYRRVGLPYLAALVLAIVCNAIARPWMDHPSVAAPPRLSQLLAHATYLTHLLGFEPLTAGTWYLAIDFQLLVLSLLLLAASQRLVSRGGAASARGPRLFVALSALLAVCSLFWFNRLPHLEDWGVYFFGAYFLGMLVAWSQHRRVSRLFVWLSLGGAALALVHDFRPRLVVALGTAVLLLWGTQERVQRRWPASRLLSGFGRISYSLFLVHFPVCLVVNAWGAKFLPPTPGAALFGLAAAFALSLGVAVIFHRTVEARCLASPKRPATSSPQPGFSP